MCATQIGGTSGQRAVGLFYQHGRGGLTKDDVQALSWFMKAANSGMGLAMHDVGFFHEYGRGGLKKNDELALKWYRQAAEHGVSFVSL